MLLLINVVRIRNKTTVNKYKMTKLVLGKPSIMSRCSAFIPVFCVAGESPRGSNIKATARYRSVPSSPGRAPEILIKFWIVAAQY